VSSTGGVMTSELAFRPRSDVSTKIRRSVVRSDIQGLRAIAVIAVILDHLFGFPLGGFVGVDVFFVISGFLITGLLLREQDRTGKISFKGFYLRRVKRIMPAALAVVVATVAVSYLILSVVRAEATLWDGLWATFFAANWHFALQGTDYFSAELAISPLQHYWSLAVEEQFYFVWPWLMALIFFIAARLRSEDSRLAHRSIAITLIAITVSSFCWAIWDTATNADWAYFSTFTRAWELGVGALIAVFAGVLTRIPDWVRPILGWVGLLGIVSAVFLVSDESGAFPAPWAALPVLATALVIMAGTGGQQSYLWPIMNPASSWIGDVSYSLYVWHFPVIVFLSALMPQGWLYYGVCAGLIAALSVLSYYGIENPIRNFNRASTAESRKRRRQRRRAGHAASPKWSIAAVSVLAIAAVGLSVLALTPRTVQQGQAIPRPDATSNPISPPQSLTAAGVLSEEVVEALGAEGWPELSPGVDQLDRTSWAPEWAVDGCLDVSDPNLEQCRYGDGEAPQTAVLLGDSVSVSWMPGLRGALEPAGYSVQSLTFGQCPAAIVDVRGAGKDDSFAVACREHNEWAVEQITSSPPDLIVVSSAANTLSRMTSDGSEADHAVVFEDAFEVELVEALSTGARVVVLPPNPRGDGLVDCYTAFSSPQDCESSPDSQYQRFASAMENAAKSSGAQFVDTLSWFCSSSACPSFIAGIPVTVEGTHLTARYSEHLVPVLADVLLANKPEN
jgi:peptidoglycan/LPS O-acetylase OafA/YrhL